MDVLTTAKVKIDFSHKDLELDNPVSPLTIDELSTILARSILARYLFVVIEVATGFLIVCLRSDKPYKRILRIQYYDLIGILIIKFNH